MLHGYSSSYRSNTRRIIYYENLKNIIWDRVKDFITTTVPHSTLSSKWEAYGLNPQFRFCRYEPGQKFAPHYDGNYAISTEDRSLYTFMIYLNGGFDGGATNFLSLSADPSDRVLESLAPSAGMLLVFQHNIYHEGEELRTGVKYMMRSDVMYKLVSASSSESDTLDNRRIVEAQELLNLAEQKEAQGRFEESIALLKKAYKLAPELEHKEAFGDPSGAPSKQEQV